ncbi:TIGR03943 family putative permease subunit [Cohnella caldifontis]|uniref:TIGR03943 family putative permease subunit n=1 Tax=Cohnella caldifontis TaxID=3027471 RepID=UPI0023EC6272|nr:TIGR03943 family protein [Cohnella sp. YIM B05605]
METATGRQIAHHVLRALILIGIAMYIVYLHRTDHLDLYIAPRMTPYVKLAACGLYIVGAVQFYMAFQLWNGKPEDCGCSPLPASASKLRSYLVYALFIFPLAVCFMTADTTIGSAMAAKKGMNLNAFSALRSKGIVSNVTVDTPVNPPAPAITDAPEASVDSGNPTDREFGSGAPVAQEQPANPLERMFPHDEYTEAYARYGMKIYDDSVITVTEKDYMETLSTLALFLNNFVGKKLTIEGFVYREDGMKDDQFVIGRFAIQCCTADAMPYGVLVTSPDAKAYKDDTWLKITGTIDKTPYNGQDTIELHAEEIRKIKAAEDPYVYPDYDFGM